MPDTLLSILMPVYNEEKLLRECVRRVLAAPLPPGVRREIVIVEDASKDGTPDIVRALQEEHADTIRAFFQEKNQGKGAAIRRAIREMKGDIAIVQDADLEYNPDEYGVVIAPILDGRADAVFGSRFAHRPERPVLNYHHTLGNLFLTHVSNFFTGLHLTDMETCYKAIRAPLLRSLPLTAKRFAIEPEITARLADRRVRIYEVPVSYRGRSYAEGKKIGWKDGISAIWTILKYWWFDDSHV